MFTKDGKTTQAFSIQSGSKEWAEEIFSDRSGSHSGKWDDTRRWMASMAVKDVMVVTFESVREARNLQSVLSDASVVVGWRKSKKTPAGEVYRSTVRRENGAYHLVLQRLK